MKNWIIGILAALLVGSTLLFAGVIPRPDFGVEVEAETNTTQVIDAVEREQEVVLLSLGLQGLTQERAVSTLLGREIPGTGRVTFLEYGYHAKLGIDGGAVEVRQTGEHTYEISVPEFQFIGHSDEDFRTAVEDNGVLSFITPDIDTAQAITKILDEDTKAQHVTDNRDLLEDQTKAFYSGIVEGIDPDATVTYEFRGGRS